MKLFFVDTVVDVVVVVKSELEDGSRLDGVGVDRVVDAGESGRTGNERTPLPLGRYQSLSLSRPVKRCKLKT